MCGHSSIGGAALRCAISELELRHELAVQIYSAVRWIETLQCLARLGCDRFLEVGPGTVLYSMVRRTLPTARVASFGAVSDLPAVTSLLADVAA